MLSDSPRLTVRRSGMLMSKYEVGKALECLALISRSDDPERGKIEQAFNELTSGPISAHGVRRYPSQDTSSIFQGFHLSTTFLGEKYLLSIHELSPSSGRKPYQVEALISTRLNVGQRLFDIHLDFPARIVRSRHLDLGPFERLVKRTGIRPVMPNGVSDIKTVSVASCLAASRTKHGSLSRVSIPFSWPGHPGIQLCLRLLDYVDPRPDDLTDVEAHCPTIRFAIGEAGLMSEQDMWPHMIPPEIETSMRQLAQRLLCSWEH